MNFIALFDENELTMSDINHSGRLNFNFCKDLSDRARIPIYIFYVFYFICLSSLYRVSSNPLW